ncbi:GTPase HflX [Candidatus Dependentiae bacterium]|nr:GTPase HflX [Candidatus Dependentiae bacterium]MBU4387134.1 GTPase HflX [Candidatus Dependentiae bacterium]MCG2755988.1 GTPase HflX [Candidatus Dependentiae bacterium]
MTRIATPTDAPQVKTLLVGIQAPYNKIRPIESYYEEFLSLVKTLGQQYQFTYFLKLRTIDKANFLSLGKLQELQKFCDENQIEEIIFSESLTPLQERNLEDFLDCTVWDREKLILEIFKISAQSGEGKIQVEMAAIEYLKSRLSGKGVELAQQEGYVGSKGPGETSKEVLKQHFSIQLSKARKRLESLERARDTQRKKRMESGIPLISLVGYTNSGKSSLLNALTKSNVLVEDKLFATLDTTTRELYLDSKKVALISDTVGFISQLPHHLIEAFKSTLDELKYSDLLLHVVDASNPTWKNQIDVVTDTLKNLEINKKMVLVFNKIDKLNQEQINQLKLETQEFTPKVFIHTKDKDGLTELLNFIKKHEF